MGCDCNTGEISCSFYCFLGVGPVDGPKSTPKLP